MPEPTSPRGPCSYVVQGFGSRVLVFMKLHGTYLCLRVSIREPQVYTQHLHGPSGKYHERFVGPYFGFWAITLPEVRLGV